MRRRLGSSASKVSPFQTPARGRSWTSKANYTYDLADRLTQVVDSLAGTITRSYDGRDNLLQEVTPLGSVTYTYDLHRGGG